MAYYLVVGDVIADVTHFGACRRLAPEDSAVPIFSAVETRVTSGGAGRVFRQLHELSPQHTRLAAYLGGDANEAAVRDLVGHGASLTEPLLVSRAGRSTPTKVRFMTENGLVFRHDPPCADDLYDDPPAADDVCRMATAWLTGLPQGESVVVAAADYGKGALAGYYWQPLFDELRRRRGLVVYDMPASLRPAACPPVGRNRLVVKMNLDAARGLLRGASPHAAACADLLLRKVEGDRSPFALKIDAAAAATVLYELQVCVRSTLRAAELEAVVVTLGGAGAVVASGRQPALTAVADYPFTERESPVYPCGCGDVFTAVLAEMLGHSSGDDRLPWTSLTGAVHRAVHIATHFAGDLTDIVVPFHKVFPYRSRP